MVRNVHPVERAGRLSSAHCCQHGFLGANELLVRLDWSWSLVACSDGVRCTGCSASTRTCRRLPDRSAKGGLNNETAITPVR